MYSRGQKTMEKTFIEWIGMEKWMDNYIANRDIFFAAAIFVSILIIIMEAVKAKKVPENLVKNAMYVGLIALSGNVICYAGFEVEFKSAYMPLTAGILMVVLVFFIYLEELFKYGIKNFIKNRRQWWMNCLKITKKICQLFYYLVLVEVLFLSFTNHLEMIEMIVCYLGTLASKSLERILEVQIKKMFRDENEIKKLDVPVKSKNDLFEPRKKQLITVCKELREIEKSPFAIMISGEWGTGKSSFLNAMREEMGDVEFIIIEGGMEVDIKKILNDIAIQIEKVFEKNKFYIGRNSSIEKYFEYIGNMADGAGYSFAGDILKGIKKENTDGYEQNKKAINEELLRFYEVVNKKIFIVVDNLDRVKDEVRDKMFDVIRESINLNCCTTVFLVDQEKIKTSHISKEFIEKYINRHIELCPISYVTIFDEYYQEFSKLELKSDYMNQRKQEIITYMIPEIESIIEKSENMLGKLEQKYSTSSDEEKLQEQCEIWQDVIERQKKRVKNPRKFKRFLFDHLGVMMKILDSVWFSNSAFEDNLYSRMDWGKIIFRIAYLKSFLYEEYDCLLHAGSLNNLRNQQTEYEIVSLVLEPGDDGSSGDKQAVIELIVYNMYSMDIKLDKSKRQELLDELRYDKLQEKNLPRYFQECIQWDVNNEYLKKILEYTLNHPLEDESMKKSVILSAAKKISSYNVRKRENIESILDTVITAIASPEICFSEEESRRLKQYEKEFRQELVTELKWTIPTVLQAMFGVDSIRTDMQQNVDGLRTLYRWLQMFDEEYPLDNNNGKYAFLQLDREAYIVQLIRTYFERMQMQLGNKEYDYVREELQVYFLTIDSTLRCMKKWNVKDGKASPIERELSLFGVGIDLDLKEVIGKQLAQETVLETVESVKEYIDGMDSDRARDKESCLIALVGAVKVYLENNYIAEETLPDAVSLMKEMYKELNENLNEKIRYEGRWSRCKIDIFTIERRMH